MSVAVLLVPALIMAQSQKITIGTMTLKDGGEYNGELSMGKPNGMGKTTWSNGNWYEGE